jgi:hypothetical protein
MIYKVDFNMKKVRQKLVKANATGYTNDCAVVFVDAEDPDDACNQGLDELKARVLDSYGNAAVIDIVETFDTEVSIKTIRKIKFFPG